MPRRTHIAMIVSFALVVSIGALAQDPPKPAAPTPADVKQAIQKGIEYLRSQQTSKGNWGFEREVPDKDKGSTATKMQEDPAFNTGVTALAALAMVENGVLPSDPAVQKAYNYLKVQAPQEKRTYNLSLTILFLTRMGSREDRPLVQKLARRLMLGQHDSGGWLYDCPVDADRESKPNPLQNWSRKAGTGDNSNTQFAVLGLWAASRFGAQVDEALELAAKRFRESQASSGGWDYLSTGKADGPATTVAGVYTLTVAAAAVSRKATESAADSSSTSSTAKTTKPTPPTKKMDTKKGDAKKDDSKKDDAKKSESATAAAGAGPGAGKAALDQDEVFQKGLKRVEEYAAGIGPTSAPYFMWSVERLAVTLQLPKFGNIDWYDQGMKALIQTQKSDGSWELNYKGVADTAFCVLFLRKANLSKDVSYALVGDASKPFVRIGKEKQEAFTKLPDAVKAAADGDSIEIMGHGPFNVAGISCEGKSLTIRTGEGFDATLIHKPELLQDAARDPRFRSALATKGGRLTLEGLRFQSDPETNSKAVWATILVDGGELRAVNCSFTQSNNAAVSAIELGGAAKVTLRNCMFVGFAAAIDAHVAASQQADLENCLVYSKVGVRAKSATPKDPAGVTVSLARSTLHVGEVVSLGNLDGPAEFHTDANIFHTDAFSTQLRPAGDAARKWTGRRNIFDLPRWLAVAGKPVLEVKDLDTWRKYWNSKEEDSIKLSAPFAVKHQLGPFRHNTNPNDWRLTQERLSPNLGADVQLGCDVYLIGAGQPYSQFKESVAYDEWLKSDSALATPASTN